MKKQKPTSIEEIEKLEKKLAAKVKRGSQKFNTEFKKFITRGNIIELAIAMVMGTAFNAIVKGLVDFVITPFTTYIIGSTVDLSELKFILREAVEETETTAAIAEVSVKYGAFIQTVINFLIIALSVFVTYKIYMRTVKLTNRREEAKKKAEEEKKKAEEEAKKAAEAERARIEKEKADAEIAARKQFFENSLEQAKLLREIRDSLNQNNQPKGQDNG